MYPYVRLIKEVIKFRRAAPMPFGEKHVSHYLCWPWDLDPWMELNNGRTLTLYDLGRIPLIRRSGLDVAMRDQRWGMTMAGACVRYRRRIRAFEPVEMHSRALCWDNKFIYVEQSMWKRNGECANHIVYRAAIVDQNGIVDPDKVAKVLGFDGPAPQIPEWIQSWSIAESQRPWPPMQD
jgi:acyl-CoA thioesterase FadM